MWPFLLLKSGEKVMKFSESLKKNIDFQTVYRIGNSNANKYLVMYVMKNNLGKNRLGISVSKKVGNSIVRHRLTRLIRESYRLQEEKFPCGLDIVIIARASAKGKSYKEIESALLHLGRLHNIVE
jgi:ribonuclease P protein component